MSMPISRLAPTVVVALFGLLSAACTHTAALTYKPSAGQQASIQAQSIALRMLDQRQNVEPTRIGFMRRGVMSGPLHESRAVSQIVLDALRAGLEADGHRIVAETERPSILVTTRLVQFTSHESGFSVQAVIVGDVVVRGTADGAPVLERRLQYEVTERMMVRLVSVYETALNKAVEQFVDRVRGLVKEAAVAALSRDRLR